MKRYPSVILRSVSVTGSDPLLMTTLTGVAGRTSDSNNTGISLSARFNDISFRALVILNSHIAAVNGLSIITAIIVELQLYSFIFGEQMINANFSNLLLSLRGAWLVDDPIIHLIGYLCAVFIFALCFGSLLALGLTNLRSRYEKPLRVLQLILATVVPQSLLIPGITVCVELLACHSPLTVALQCGSFQHVIVAIISLVVILLMTAVAYFYESVFFDLTPAPPTASLLARTDRTYHCHLVLLRLLLSATATLQAPTDPTTGVKPWALASVVLFTNHYSAYSFLEHQPYTNPSVAMISAASIWIRVWLSQVLMFQTYYNGASWNNAILAGIFLTCLHGFGTLVIHNQELLKAPLQDLSVNDLSSRIKLEVMSIQPSRAVSWFLGHSKISFTKKKSLHDKSVKRIRDLVDLALEKFPDSVRLHCQLCSVIYSVLQEPSWADRVILHARASMATLDFSSAFMVHRLQNQLNSSNKTRAEMLQKMALEKQVAAANSKIDLAIYRQMQLWRHLLRGPVADPAHIRILKIAALSTEISIAVESAFGMLEKLSTATSGADVAVLRQQAHFYMAVLGDVQTGTRLLEKADAVESHMREIHHEFDGAANDGDANHGNSNLTMGAIPNTNIVVMASGIDVGIVREATPEALVLLGRDEGDLVGKNISVILPDQISKQHDHLVRRFVSGAGEREIVDITRELFAIHGRTKHLILIKVTLSLMPDDPDHPSAIAVIAKMQPLDKSIIAALLDASSLKILYGTESFFSIVSMQPEEGLVLTELFPDLQDNMPNAFGQDGVLVSVADSSMSDKAIVKLKSLLSPSLLMAKIDLQQVKIKGSKLTINRPLSHSRQISTSERSRSENEDPIEVADESPFRISFTKEDSISDISKTLSKKQEMEEEKAESEGQSSLSSSKSSLSAIRKRIWHSRNRTDVLVLRIVGIILAGSAIMLVIIIMDVNEMIQFLSIYQDRFTQMATANRLEQSLIQLGFILQTTSIINAGFRLHYPIVKFEAFNDDLSSFESDTYAFLAYGESSTDSSYQNDRVVIEEEGFPTRYLSFPQGVKNLINRAKEIDRNSSNFQNPSNAFILNNFDGIAAGFGNLARIAVEVGVSSNQSVRNMETTELTVFSVVCFAVAVFICPRLIYAKKSRNDLLDIFLQVPQDQVLSMLNRFRTSLSDNYIDEGENEFLLDDKLGDTTNGDTNWAAGKFLLQVFKQWLSLSSLALSAYVLSIVIYFYRQSAFEQLNEIFNDSYESGRRAILLEWFLFDAQRAMLTQNVTLSQLAVARLTLGFDLHHALEFGGRVISDDISAGWPASPGFILANGPVVINDIVFQGSIKRYSDHETLWYSESADSILSGAAQAVYVDFYQLGLWVLTQQNISSPDFSELEITASRLRLALNADTDYYTDEMTSLLYRLLIGTKITIAFFCMGWTVVFALIVTPTLRDLNTQLYRTRFLCTLIPYSCLKELPLFREKFSNFALDI